MRAAAAPPCAGYRGIPGGPLHHRRTDHHAAPTPCARVQREWLQRKEARKAVGVRRRQVERATAEDLEGFLALIVVQSFDQQDAVEVVELVLEHASFELGGFDRDLVAVEIEADEMDRVRPHDLPAEPGDGQTALLERPLAFT